MVLSSSRRCIVLLVRSAVTRATFIAGMAMCAPAMLVGQKGDKDKGDDCCPAYVLIIRHAEKPPDDSKSPDLAPRGIARAKALPQLFTKSAKRPDPFPKPDYIFATHDTKQSHRPTQTADPLGAALGLKIDQRFGDPDVKPLAREILERKQYAGKTILIVWHQGTIPDLAKALGANDAPHAWKNSVFDRVWVLSYDKKGKPTFENRPQQLLIGDSEK
jgi:broad specificity phosphatase PhoE